MNSFPRYVRWHSTTVNNLTFWAMMKLKRVRFSPFAQICNINLAAYGRSVDIANFRKIFCNVGIPRNHSIIVLSHRLLREIDIDRFIHQKVLSAKTDILRLRLREGHGEGKGDRVIEGKRSGYSGFELL